MLKFYIRSKVSYLANTLLLVEEENMNCTFLKFNLFGSNLEYLINCFEDEKAHSLSIETDNIDTDLYCKLVNKGQYLDINMNNLQNNLHKVSLLSRRENILIECAEWLFFIYR